HPRADGVESDPAAHEQALPPRPRQGVPHGEAVLAAAPSDLELVSRQPDVQPVEVLAELLADKGVRIVPCDVPLVRLPALRIRDDRFELCQRIHTERMAYMRGFHKRITPGSGRLPGQR